jgi:multidrug efflux system membrane fusion protein
VHAADANGIAVITQIHPIAVIFTLPEDVIQQVLQASRNGTLQAEAYSRDDVTKIGSGKLLTINNLIDPTTGTDRLKAVFDNSENNLWPNQFVNIHLLVAVKKNAIIAPVAAVQHSSQGTYAYVVKPDKTVEMRQVKVSTTEGNLVAVDSGLNPGDLVVTDGQDKLQPNSKVEVRQTGFGQRGQNAQNGGNTQQADNAPPGPPPGVTPMTPQGAPQSSAPNQGMGQPPNQGMGQGATQQNAPANPASGANNPQQGRRGRRR